MWKRDGGVEKGEGGKREEEDGCEEKEEEWEGGKGVRKRERRKGGEGEGEEVRHYFAWLPNVPLGASHFDKVSTIFVKSSQVKRDPCSLLEQPLH